MQLYRPDRFDPRLGSIVVLLAVLVVFTVVTAFALVIVSKRLANVSSTLPLILSLKYEKDKSKSIWERQSTASANHSSSKAQDRVPFAAGNSPLSILYQHYRFVVDGPGLIRQGYARFSDGLFEIPRTFRFGQVILCKPELIEELKNTRSAVASPEPWIDQVGKQILRCPSPFFGHREH